MRFRDVCLADLGDALPKDSVETTSGYPYGTPVFRSPEATLMMPFTTAHDIWSFGATVRPIPRLISPTVTCLSPQFLTAAIIITA
jgi:serine/threonine protein kinase